MSWTNRNEYYEEVESDAHEIVKQVGGKENYHDTLHEWADNAVIYTATCEDIVRFSRSDNAVFDQMGSDALAGCESTYEVSSRTAYFAYSQDVAEVIEAMDDDEVMELLGKAECGECMEVVPKDEVKAHPDFDYAICTDCIEDHEEGEE